MLFNTCELQKKIAGQNTALIDKWRHSNDVIVIEIPLCVSNNIPYKTYISEQNDVIL